jgi:hypothetical protein
MLFFFLFIYISREALYKYFEKFTEDYDKTRTIRIKQVPVSINSSPNTQPVKSPPKKGTLS